jgi:hypothetical protein
MAAAVTAALLFTSFAERSLAQGGAQGKGGVNGLPDDFKAGGAKGGKGKGKAKGPAGPTPRLADGKVNFGPIAGQKGVWSGGAGLTLVSNQAPDSIDNVLQNRPANPRADQVPFLPWAKSLYEHRRETLTADDPHVRCKSSAGARLYHTPYGFEIIQVPEMQQVFMMGVGGPHTYRTIYMDGRPHPADLDPSYHGHSIGSWDGDTLVVDSIGFNTRMWFSREGLPHTEQLQTIEKFQRPDHNTLLYTITVDDPGAYTAPWTGGWTIPWSATGEMYEFICQENTRDSKHMFGGDSKQ